MKLSEKKLGFEMVFDKKKIDLKIILLILIFAVFAGMPSVSESHGVTEKNETQEDLNSRSRDLADLNINTDSSTNSNKNTNININSANNHQIQEVDIYKTHISPLFEKRCIACHSCFNAPCQLNLQSWEGFQRGATNLNIYDGLRLKAVSPTRMFIDAQTTEEWREKGFYSVNNSNDINKNLFLEMLRVRRNNSSFFTSKNVESSMVCPSKTEQINILGLVNKELGMPFGFPALTESEYETFESWIKIGAPGSVNKKSLSENVKLLKTRIEAFFNQKSLQEQLVARYLYEHLFLAHIYIDKKAENFFRLVRSRSDCQTGISEIATRRPNDDPQEKKVFYCLKEIEGPFVLKTHMPFELTSEKLDYWKKIFFDEQKWSIEKMPDYSAGIAQNPFKAFAAIPQVAKYKFLLSDAQYHVNTFIKGPVCNGTNAVNSIQEQFYVFFVSPNSIPLADPSNLPLAQDLLVLPGNFGSQVEVTEIPKIAKEIQGLREKYRALKTDWFKKNKAEGFGVEDIWDGDGFNNNAVLTVFRHNDNAVVMRGPRGNLSKTLFLLDYSLFERLVYNLVVNFDVFGNVGHQLLTRVYMDYIRMEAEENFLQLLPPERRLKYRNAWYQGVLTEEKMKNDFPVLSLETPTRFKFTKDFNHKGQVVEQILSKMSDVVKGEFDTLNWRALKVPGMKGESLSASGKELKGIVSIRSQGNFPFARYFPETAYLVIKNGEGVKEVYSLIHNREFQNVSWILAESLRRSPHEDTLTLQKGFWVPYPELIFEVNEKDVSQFVKDIRAIENIFQYPSFEKKYSLAASSPQFWKSWDEIHEFMKKTEGPQFGNLDLTRYQR